MQTDVGSDKCLGFVVASRQLGHFSRTQKAGRGYAEISWALLAEINLVAPGHTRPEVCRHNARPMI
jgi:hypothetical protein